MRVIAGRAKGRLLQAVPGEGTRPITDRVKAALFSILSSQEMIEGRRYLDLFGGTGAVGIEALSRGAAEVVFCEIDRRALRVLQRNLETSGVAERSVVIAGDAFNYLARPSLGVFDVIYIAPPQYRGIWLTALQRVDARPELLAEEGCAIVQVFPKEWREPGIANLSLLDHRKYGSTALYFFGKKERDAAAEPGNTA
jgi:16S rRNA (guanine966-N2)-methyltransferase